MYRRRSGVEVRLRKPLPRAPVGNSEATRPIVARPHPGRTWPARTTPGWR